MSDVQQDQTLTPSCPLCASETVLKQVDREATRRLEVLVFKCVVCAVEYPVVAALKTVR